MWLVYGFPLESGSGWKAKVIQYLTIPAYPVSRTTFTFVLVRIIQYVFRRNDNDSGKTEKAAQENAHPNGSSNSSRLTAIETWVESQHLFQEDRVETNWTKSPPTTYTSLMYSAPPHKPRTRQTIPLVPPVGISRLAPQLMHQQRGGTIRRKRNH